MALSEAEPANARGQALEGDALARHLEPAVQVLVVWEERLHFRVGPVDVLGIAGERHPAERALAFAEERADVRGHEAGKRERVGHAFVLRDLADVVAVVHGGNAAPVQLEHRVHVLHDRRARRRFHRLGIGLLLRLPALDAPSRGKVAVHEIVRRGLVGDEVGPHAAARDLGKDLGRVAEEAHGHRRLGVEHHRQRFVEVRRLLVEVARAQPHVDARLPAFDGEHRGARHGRGQRLRAAHAAEARGENPSCCRIDAVARAAVVLAHRLGEGLVGSLHDALRADVDPRARGHLPVHHEALAVELVEVVPRRPLRHQVRIGDEHARRVGVRLEYRHGLARLHQQRLVVAQALQRREDRVEAFPVARRLADAAIHHELRGVLGDLGVEVVLDHAERRFREPAPAGEGAAPRGAHDHGGCRFGSIRYYAAMPMPAAATLEALNENSTVHGGA